MILYQTSWLRLTYEARLRLIELEWLGPVASDDMRQGLAHTLALAKQCQARTWLALLRHMPPLSVEDQTWVHQWWAPRFADLGLEKVAIVNSPQIRSRNSVAAVSQGVREQRRQGPQPATRYFDDEAQARDWVRTPLVTNVLGY